MKIRPLQFNRIEMLAETPKDKILLANMADALNDNGVKFNSLTVNDKTIRVIFETSDLKMVGAWD